MYYEAGFEITAVSDEELDKVRSLIRELLSEFQIPVTETPLQPSRERVSEATAQAGPVHIQQFERTYELFVQGEGVFSGPQEDN